MLRLPRLALPACSAPQYNLPVDAGMLAVAKKVAASVGLSSKYTIPGTNITFTLAVKPKIKAGWAEGKGSRQAEKEGALPGTSAWPPSPDVQRLAIPGTCARRWAAPACPPPRLSTTRVRCGGQAGGAHGGGPFVS